jgi:L-aspartate semialdehyde sulfurtransferase ferredoxin
MKNKLVLKFPQSLLDKPILSRVIKKFDLEFNILHAQIQNGGILILELSGEDSNYKDALNYLKSLKVDVQPLSKDISKDEDKCVNCTACISHCPTKALDISDRKTMKVDFDADKCIACEACIPVCSYKAMSIRI